MGRQTTEYCLDERCAICVAFSGDFVYVGGTDFSHLENRIENDPASILQLVKYIGLTFASKLP